MSRSPLHRLAARALALAGIVLWSLTSAPVAQAAGKREHLDVRLLAQLPAPGSPASFGIGEDGTIYTASYKHDPGDASPSAIFALSPQGRLLRTYEVEGQQRQGIEGASVAGVDAEGMVYVVNQRPAFAFRLDPRSGRQERYGTFADLKPCGTAAPGAPCSPTLLDLPPSPNYSVFGEDGSLYTTDFQQAVVWRIPRGGGEAEVWLSDPRLDNGPFGTSGIEWLPDGRLLLGTFASTGAPTEPDAAASRIFAVPVAGGRAGLPVEVWQGEPGDFPDDFAVARSGNVYVTLAGRPNAVIELGPDFQERARLTETGAAIPFDTPSAITFDGCRLLVANLSLRGEEAHWAIFDVWAGERGLASPRPSMVRPGAQAPAQTARGAGCGRGKEGRMPKVAGLRMADAVQRVRAAAYRTSIRWVRDRRTEKGRVVRASVSAGRRLAQGTRVTLFISRGQR